MDAGGFRLRGKKRLRRDQLMRYIGNGGVLRSCLSFLPGLNPQVENVPELALGVLLDD
jgi:hypothetical protein